MGHGWLFTWILVCSTGSAQLQPTDETTCGTSLPFSMQQPASGPIRQALMRETDWLIEPDVGAAAARQAPWGQRFALSDWSRVLGLGAGTEIKLILVGVREARRYVLHVDDSGITVLNLAHPSLSASVRETLRDTARYNPGALLGASLRARSVDPAVRIGPDGLFHDGRKIADLIDIIATHARSEVLQISRREKRGSRLGGFAGGMIGFLYGTRAAVSLGFKQCGRSCSDEGALMVLSLIGLPIASGFAGYHLAAHRVDVIEYRAWRP